MTLEENTPEDPIYEPENLGEAEMPAETEITVIEISDPGMSEEEGEPVKMPPSGSGPTPLTPSEERTWSLIAHLSILANLITGFLGPVIALIIYLVFRDRSRYVAYQSFQAFLFQLVFWVGAGALIGVLWALVGILSIVLVGLCLIPIACAVSLVPLFSLGYGVAAAIQTGQGEDFQYWLVGKWTHDLIEK
jgi:uncharacterized Tic20 family protein